MFISVFGFWGGGVIVYIKIKKKGNVMAIFKKEVAVLKGHF